MQTGHLCFMTAHVFGVKLFGYFYHLMSSYVSNYNKFISNVDSMVEPLV